MRKPALQQANWCGRSGQLKLGNGFQFAGVGNGCRIGRQNQTDILLRIFYGARQAAGHIGKAAGFDEGVRLTGGKQNVHDWYPILL